MPVLRIYRQKVVNERKEYRVWQVDEVMNFMDEGGVLPQTFEYDESVTYSTYEKASNATDKDFEGTDEDYDHVTWQNVYNTSQNILEGTMQQLNPGKIRRAISKTANKLEQQLHHLVSRGLKNTNNFVKKAIEGGFHIDGKGNLTPVIRFIKKYGFGVHGKHPKYTKQIDDFLNGLDLTKYTPTKAKALLEKLNDHIIDKIRKNPNTKINDLDLDLKNFKIE